MSEKKTIFSLISRGLFWIKSIQQKKEGRMKVVLCCHDFDIDDERYHKFLRGGPYFFELHQASILPIGTVIDVKSDPMTMFTVISHWYYLEKNVLSMSVDLWDTDLSPEEFADYLEKHWIHESEMDY